MNPKKILMLWPRKIPAARKSHPLPHNFSNGQPLNKIRENLLVTLNIKQLNK